MTLSFEYITFFLTSFMVEHSFQILSMAGPHKPTWMPTWCLRGMNSDIGWSGLNRAIGRFGLNRAIGLLISHGVESALWATIPPIMRHPMAEIT